MTHFAPSVEHKHTCIMHLISYHKRNAILGYLPMPSLMTSSHMQYRPLSRSYAALLLNLCALFPQFMDHGRQCFRVDAILDQGYTKRQCATVQMCVKQERDLRKDINYFSRSLALGCQFDARHSAWDGRGLWSLKCVVLVGNHLGWVTT